MPALAPAYSDSSESEDPHSDDESVSDDEVAVVPPADVDVYTCGSVSMTCVVCAAVATVAASTTLEPPFLTGPLGLALYSVAA